MSLEKFNFYLEKKVVKRVTPNFSRAKFFLKECERDYLYLHKLKSKMGVEDYGANNYIKMCYDIILGLVRAKMLMEGYHASGFGAHEAEVAYFGELKYFKEKDVAFLDEIRFFRNRMLYYGRTFDKEYAKKVVLFTKKVYPILKKLIEEKK